MRRNAEQYATEDADAGMVEAAAEHEVNTVVDAAQQAKLARQQDAGAGY